VPENLIESEFFGYEKGSFTGASNSGKQGLFELATGGSIFLDEIGDLPIHLQAKILRVIQERKLRRIGGEKEIAVDVRIISATHHDLQSMVKEGTFREDLYYRLNVVPVHIRPLRERKEDIPVLTQYFIETIGGKMGKEKIEISDLALEKLKNYSWPGNIRELQNIIERAVIFAEDIIEVEHLSFEETAPDKTKDHPAPEGIKLPVDLNEIIAATERKYILEAKSKLSSSREIAKALGISHTTVINKIKAYDL
jgi:transcriptional regulator of aroF, aroG, tyrA and aromatic amino acid transport